MRFYIGNLSKLVVFAVVSAALVMLPDGVSRVYATHAIIDSILIDENAGDAADVVPLTGDIYAVAYELSTSIQISTYSINPDGTAINTIDSATIIGGNSVSAVKVSDDIIAIAYEKSGVGDQLAVTTVQIDSFGMIGSIIQTADLGALRVGLRGISFIRSHHNNDIFVIGNQEDVGPAKIDYLIKTLEIGPAGAISLVSEFTIAETGGDGVVTHANGDAYVIVENE